MTYKEQLLDPRWQRKRLAILGRDGFTCRKCLDSTSTLHVHHKFYIKGVLAWEYDDFYLITLCASCHEIETLIDKQAARTIINLRQQNYIVPDFCPACGNPQRSIITPFEIHCNICGYRNGLEMTEEKQQILIADFINIT